MALDSKSLPLYAGLLVLLIVGVFVVGRGVLGPGGGQTPTGAALPSAATLSEPKELHPQLEAGRESIREGQLEQAKAQLAQVPNTDVGYLLALNDLGLVHQRLGESQEALAAFGRILELDPENAFALYGVCQTQIGLGDLGAAELACLRILEIDPRNAAARFAIGLIRVAQDKLVLGVDAYLRAAQQHQDENRIRRAAIELDIFSQAHPGMAGPHYALAVLSRFLKSHETEREELETYLRLAPDGIAAANAREKLDELTKMGF